MTDPGVAELDGWANRNPRTSKTIIVASMWAVLHGIALFLGWIGVGFIGGLFSGLANLLAVGWAVVLVYLNWDRVAPAIERAKEWFHVTVSRRTLRSYRYEGERSAHEEQARETTISLGLMAQAAADDPTQVRMASDIEHGAEARLSVLLGKPQLSLAEKRERDAIQMALQARRAGFDTAPAVAPAPRPMGFVSLAAPSLPIGWIVAALAIIAALVQTIRVDRVKDEAADNAAFREGNRQVAEQWRENAEGWRDHARKVEADGTVTAGVLAEREAIIARARVNERRNRHAVEQVARDVPPVWFGGVQPPGDGEVGRGSADGGSGAGAGDPG